MREQSTVSLGRADGVEFTLYNSVIGEDDVQIGLNGKMYDGFYISYNNHDRDIYGDVTTALVVGQMQKFYILNGNHCMQYKELINQGFNKCFEYFKENINKANRYSDKLD